MFYIQARLERKVVKAKFEEGPVNLLPNENINFYKWHWADGSTAIIDSRGLVHLKSSNQHLPEITIVLVGGRQTACWASDGVVSGVDYYINEKITRKVYPEEFQKLYIQPFIDRLL
jgi:hypothetical protein